MLRIFSFAPYWKGCSCHNHLQDERRRYGNLRRMNFNVKHQQSCCTFWESFYALWLFVNPIRNSELGVCPAFNNSALSNCWHQSPGKKKQGLSWSIGLWRNGFRRAGAKKYKLLANLSSLVIILPNPRISSSFPKSPQRSRTIQRQEGTVNPIVEVKVGEIQRSQNISVQPSFSRGRAPPVQPRDLFTQSTHQKPAVSAQLSA